MPIHNLVWICATSDRPRGGGRAAGHNAVKGRISAIEAGGMKFALISRAALIYNKLCLLPRVPLRCLLVAQLQGVTPRLETDHASPDVAILTIKKK